AGQRSHDEVEMRAHEVRDGALIIDQELRRAVTVVARLRRPDEAGGARTRPAGELVAKARLDRPHRVGMALEPGPCPRPHPGRGPRGGPPASRRARSGARPGDAAPPARAPLRRSRTGSCRRPADRAPAACARPEPRTRTTAGA